MVDDLLSGHGFSTGRIENQLADIRIRQIGFQFAQQRINVDNAATGRHDMLNEPNQFLAG